MEVFSVRRINTEISIYTQILTSRQKYALDAANVSGVICSNDLRMVKNFSRGYFWGILIFYRDI